MSAEQTIFDLEAEANMETRSLCHLIAAILFVGAVAVCFCGLLAAGVMFGIGAGAAWAVPSFFCPGSIF